MSYGFSSYGRPNQASNFATLDAQLGVKQSMRTAYGNTTIERRGDGAIAVKLHETDVVDFYSNCIELNAGGWYTITTCAVMNSYLPRGIQVASDRGKWYVFISGTPVRFYDGMRIDVRNGVEGACVLFNPDAPDTQADDRYNAELVKKIKTYVENLDHGTAYDALEDMSEDCWFCQGFGEDEEHLLLHMEEGCYPGSMLINAYKEAGYESNYQTAFSYDVGTTRFHSERVHKILTKYLKKHLMRGAVAVR